MTYLFFDTETVGLPIDYEAPSADIQNWPRIVQISWILSNERDILKEQDFIIKPNGFTISENASKVHDITTQLALENGTDIAQVLRLFLEDLKEADRIVGHNINFDKKVVGAELVRLGEEDVLMGKYSICTMMESTNFCKLIQKSDNAFSALHMQSIYDYKWPKLSELYFKLFNSAIEGAHNSMADVEATFKCFWKLKELGIITESDESGRIATLSPRGVIQIGKSHPLVLSTLNIDLCQLRVLKQASEGFNSLLIKKWNILELRGLHIPQTIWLSLNNTFKLAKDGIGVEGKLSLFSLRSFSLTLDNESVDFMCEFITNDFAVLRIGLTSSFVVLTAKNRIFHDIESFNNYINLKIFEKKQEERKAQKSQIENDKNRAIERYAYLCANPEKAVKSDIEAIRFYIGSYAADKVKNGLLAAEKKHWKQKDKRRS